MEARSPEPLFEVGPSTIHGLGVFALTGIRAGQRVIDYQGEYLTAEAVAARYDEAAADDPHTFLFRVGHDLYVDASVGGNEARLINHSCDPNCEADVDGDRIFIRAIRDIPPGVELTYDYALEIEDDPPPDRASLFVCRCGTPRCRGSMIESPRED
jgi:SET domain-containing protein